MAMANWMVPCTISTLATLGSTWSRVMRQRPLPAARAAKMKSRDHTVIAAPREIRANTGMLKMPMAVMLTTRPGP
jgi:hypothetical protein